jgi:hypothetical protein
MSPAKVVRSKVKQLTDLPNIGKASAEDLRVLGIRSPEQLAGKCPFELYERLCRKTGVRHDPCVIDVFMSVTSFMDGGPAKAWWDFTEERKRRVGEGALIVDGAARTAGIAGGRDTAARSDHEAPHRPDREDVPDVVDDDDAPR